MMMPLHQWYIHFMQYFWSQPQVHSRPTPFLFLFLSRPSFVPLTSLLPWYPSRYYYRYPFKPIPFLLTMKWMEIKGIRSSTTSFPIDAFHDTFIDPFLSTESFSAFIHTLISRTSIRIIAHTSRTTSTRSTAPSRLSPTSVGLDERVLKQRQLIN